MPANATEQPKAVASGWETILIDQASMTSSVVSTPSQKSNRRHTPAILSLSEETPVSAIHPRNALAMVLCPLERGDSWLATKELENPPFLALEPYPLLPCLSSRSATSVARDALRSRYRIISSP